MYNGTCGRRCLTSYWLLPYEIFFLNFILCNYSSRRLITTFIYAFWFIYFPYFYFLHGNEFHVIDRKTCDANIYEAGYYQCKENYAALRSHKAFYSVTFTCATPHALIDCTQPSFNRCFHSPLLSNLSMTSAAISLITPLFPYIFIHMEEDMKVNTR